jgi:hypothetical protein
MENNDTPAEYKDKFYILFIGEFWSDNPIYETWTEGRIEFRKWGNPKFNRQGRQRHNALLLAGPTATWSTWNHILHGSEYWHELVRSKRIMVDLVG